MKRTVIAFFALAVLATLVVLATVSKHSVRAVYAQSGGCTDATLNASYAFTYTGFTTPRSPVKGHEDPIAVVGVLTFDGAGNVSTSYTFAFRGEITTNQSGAGTYTVNSDCTGSISFTTGDAAGITFNMVIIGGGAEISAIDTRSSFTATLDAKKQ